MKIDLEHWNELVLRAGFPELTPSEPASSSSENSGEPQPFEELITPLVEDASVRISAREDGWHPLEAPAVNALRQSLAELLTGIMGRPLQELLSEFRAEDLRCGRGQGVYERFIAAALPALFSRFPELEETVTCTVDDWIASGAEFLTRLHTDAGELAAAFGYPQGLGCVTQLQPMMSDRHDQGRSVIGLRFACGLELVYKPKDVASEVFFFDFVAWLNANNAPYDLKQLKIIARGGYGWAEFVHQQSCNDLNAVHLYYRRAGALLCVLYLLQAGDCHFENLIASGEYPVLIDTEMLLQPSVDAERTRLSAAETGHRSVARTGLIPQIKFTSDGGMYDLSGLGAAFEQRTPLRIPRWRNVNTDKMALGFTSASLPVQANVPRVCGQVVLPFNHLDDIIQGFTEMYRFLLSRKRSLDSADGPLAPARLLKSRFVVRDTLTYHLALNYSLHPSFVGQRGSRILALRHMQPLPAPFDEISDREQGALLRLDVPRFMVDVGGRNLLDQDEVILCQCFDRSGQEQLTDAINTLSVVDLEDQVRILETVWAIAKVSKTLRSCSANGH